MEEKRKAGRPAGRKKNLYYLGYRYSGAEVEEMKSILEDYKKKYNCGTTKAIIEMFRKIKEVENF